jgi:hypothetical protein
MILIRLAAAGLAVGLHLAPATAWAIDPAATGSIDRSPGLAIAPDAPAGSRRPGSAEIAAAAAVTLPEQSVTAAAPKPLPPLKPLPKWDPGVCTGC